MRKQQRRMVVSDESARYYPSDVLSLDELSYWIAFSRVLGIGPVRFKLLLAFFYEDVAAAWQASSAALAEAGLDQKTIKSFIRQRASIIPLQELERLDRLRVRIITWKDETYPPLLRKIEYAPSVLYICGNLTDDDRHYSLGIVGTRKMSAYGRQVTEHFAQELARGKVTNTFFFVSRTSQGWMINPDLVPSLPAEPLIAAVNPGMECTITHF